jgi:hypothetical protein
MAFNTTVWTYVLTGETLYINETDNVLNLSVICTTGTITVNGSGRFQGISSGAITFAAGQGFTLSSKNIQSPITGVTITASVGNVAEILLSKN